MARTYFPGKDQSADLSNASEVLVKKRNDATGAVEAVEIVLGARHLNLSDEGDVAIALAACSEIPADAKAVAAATKTKK